MDTGCSGTSAYDDFDHHWIRILGRLKPGVSLAQAQKAVNAVEAQIAAAHPDTDSGNRVVLVPIREQLVGDIRKPLLLLMAAAFLVLLIACANTAGLALARDAERQKEIAVRLALGATRLRLLRQFITESLVLAAIGGAIGIPLAFAGTHFLLTLFPNEVANLDIPKVTAIPMDRGVFLFAFAITLLTAVLAGIAPVLKAMRTKADTTMSGNNSRQHNIASRQPLAQHSRRQRNCALADSSHRGRTGRRQLRSRRQRGPRLPARPCSVARSLSAHQPLSSFRHDEDASVC